MVSPHQGHFCVMRIFEVLKRSSENGFKGIKGYRFSDDLFPTI